MYRSESKQWNEKYLSCFQFCIKTLCNISLKQWGTESIRHGLPTCLTVLPKTWISAAIALIASPAPLISTLSPFFRLPSSIVPMTTVPLPVIAARDATGINKGASCKYTQWVPWIIYKWQHQSRTLELWDASSALPVVFTANACSRS